MRTISPQIARRLAISAQRLTGPRPSPNADGMLELFRDLRCVQIDPIRAVERTELLVLMTPRALEDDDQLRAASAELRQRMRTMSLQPMSLGAGDAAAQPPAR